MLLHNLSRLLDDPRRRSTILVTFLVLLTMVFIGGIRLFHQMRGKNLPKRAYIESMRPIRSVPGGVKNPTTQNYANLQIEHNKQKAKNAQSNHQSSIASLVDSVSLEDKASSLKPLNRYKESTNPLPSFMSETEKAMHQHQAFMDQQRMELSTQQMQGAVHQQMNHLFNEWNKSPTQASEVSILEGSLTNPLQQDLSSNNALVKAGTILSAVLLTAVNSDEPSPVLAQITTGDFKDGRLIGTLSRVGERLLIQFHTLNLPNSSQTMSIQALAVDETTARTSLASAVDRHTLLRYGSFFAATFIHAMSTRYVGGPLANSHQGAANGVGASLLSATGQVGSHFGSELAQRLHTPPTVYVHAGASVGVLFTSDLLDSSHSKV